MIFDRAETKDYWKAKHTLEGLTLLDWIQKLEEELQSEWKPLEWNNTPFASIKGTVTRFYGFDNRPDTISIDWAKRQTDGRISLHITKQPGKLGTHSQLDLWEQAPIKLLKDGILLTHPAAVKVVLTQIFREGFPSGTIVRFTLNGEPIDPFPFLVKITV
jgi:hypothetical protein